MAAKFVITDAGFEAARLRGEARARENQRAVRARYDRHARRIVVRLASGMDLQFPRTAVQELEHATPEQLAEVRVEGVGYSLHWPSLDFDIGVQTLIMGLTGDEAWIARRDGARIK